MPLRDRSNPFKALSVAVAVGICLAVVTPLRAQVSPGPLSRPHRDLEGTLKCFQCHGSSKELMDGKCLDCHTDIAWLREQNRGLHASKGLGTCASCHPDHGGVSFELIQWPDGSAEKFNHAQSGWRLQGRHAELECQSCHQAKHQNSHAASLGPKRSEPGKRWTGLETTCVSCHQDVHKGALGADCASCHSQSKWRPVSSFDHAKTHFPLLGKHAPVECGKCHMASNLKLSLGSDGKPAPLYKPLPHAECSSCHQDPHTARLGPACSRCHVADDWKKVPQKGFDHSLTKYPLRGRHAGILCAECHDATRAWGKRPVFSSCASCHQDSHAGTATLAGKKVDCASCHDVAGWKPSTFTAAQHSKSKYPLDGKHQQVACSACHLKNPPGRTAVSLGTSGVLIRASFDRCMSCHADAHNGQVASREHKGACEACHTVAGWRPSTYTVEKHATLKMSLAGKHATIACAACHGPSRKDLPPLPGPERIGVAKVALLMPDLTCTACHHDPHEGRFAAKGAHPKTDGCVSCHDMNSFSPSTIDVGVHAKFGYPLAGAHRAVACDRCHVESKPAPIRSSLVLARGKAPGMAFVVSDQRCATCHEDIHGGQFARRPDHGACSACHDEDRFRPAPKFNHERDSDFRLAGAHARVACNKCHVASQKDAAGRAFIVYRPVPRDCKMCHGAKSSPSRFTEGRS